MSNPNPCHCLVRPGWVFALTATVFGLHVATVHAQSSRAELIAEQQSEKSEQLGLEGPGGAEKAVMWVMNSPLLAGNGGAYPLFGSAYQGTGMAVGAGYLRRMPRRSRVNVAAAVSTRGSSVIDVRARLPELGRGLFTVSAAARRTEAKDLPFYGLGPDSPLEERLEYDYQPIEAGVSATLQPLSWFQLTGDYRWLDFVTTVRSSGETVDAPGLGAGLSYHVTRVNAAVDWRTSPGYSTRGGLYRMTWSHYQESRNRPFSFDSMEYEAVQLVPILREQFGFAVRALVTLTMTDGGERVPFVLAPYLGSGETLRGFDTWRFTDANRILLTGEYRWRPSRFLDMAVFLDAGKVAPHRSELNLSRLETNWGMGARFHGPSFTAFRAEVARSHEGWRLILAGQQSF